MSKTGFLSKKSHFQQLFRSFLSQQGIWFFLILIFFVAFLFYPLLFVIKGALCPKSHCTLEYVYLLITSPNLQDLFLNSVYIAGAVTLATIVISLPLALLMTKKIFVGQSLIRVLLLAPLILPPFVGVIALRQIFGRLGTLNLILIHSGFIAEPINWLGSGAIVGIILVQALHLYPIMYFGLCGALQTLDRSLDEAAQLSGASQWQRFRKVTFPLLTPSLFASAVLIFVSSFTDLGTPIFFEFREVIPVRLFYMLNEQGENPIGYALVVFVALLSLLGFLATRSIGEKRDFSGSGRGAIAHVPKRLTIAQTCAVLPLLLVFIGISLLPHLGVLLTSFADKWFMTPFPSSYTFSHYREVFAHPLTLTAIKNSLFLSSLSMSFDVVIGVAMAFLITRGNLPGKRLLDMFALLPLAIPGIVIAFGYVGGFAGTFLDNRIHPFPLLIVAYAMRRLPYMVRSTVAGFQATPRAMEEAATLSGLSSFKILQRISFPLLSGYILSGAIFCFAFAMLEVSDSLILAFEESSYPLSKALYALSGRPDGIPLAAALSVITMLIILGCFIVARILTGKDSTKLISIS